MVKLIDEATAELYTLTKKEMTPEVYQAIVAFTKAHAPQFKERYRKK